MKIVEKWAIAVLLCTLISAGLFGCNTIRGAGKDIQRGGEGIENAADREQHN